MKNILIVDDEKTFLLSLTEGLQARNPKLRTFTAGDGQGALDILRANEIDLMVTDLKMPIMDGFGLLAVMNQEFSNIPVIVMTAFGTPEIEERIESLGSVSYLDKPIDISSLESKINDVLDQSTNGFIQGITLPTFVQIIAMEGKSCTLDVSSEKKTGTMYFLNGELIDAESGDFEGEEAAFMIFSWSDVAIKVKNAVWQRRKRIESSLPHILLKACEYQDEKEWSAVENNGSAPGMVTEEVVGDPPLEEENPAVEIVDVYKNFTLEEESLMSVQEKLGEFKSIDGFMGAGVFTPGGEALTMLSNDDKIPLNEIGILANNVLMNAQKASLDMGTGRGQLVHIEAENAHILVRCLNEGKDPLASEPGKAHIHLVLIMNSESIGMAKLKIGKIIESLADDFRP